MPDEVIEEIDPNRIKYELSEPQIGNIGEMPAYGYFELTVIAGEKVKVRAEDLNKWNEEILNRLEQRNDLADLPLFILVSQNKIENYMQLMVQVEQTTAFAVSPQFKRVLKVMRDTGGGYITYPVEGILKRTAIAGIATMLGINVTVLETAGTDEDPLFYVHQEMQRMALAAQEG